MMGFSALCRNSSRKTTYLQGQGTSQEEGHRQRLVAGPQSWWPWTCASSSRGQDLGCFKQQPLSQPVLSKSAHGTSQPSAPRDGGHQHPFIQRGGLRLQRQETNPTVSMLEPGTLLCAKLRNRSCRCPPLADPLQLLSSPARSGAHLGTALLSMAYRWIESAGPATCPTLL